MIAALSAVPASAASAKLNRTSTELPIGYSVTLKATGLSGDVKWSSSDSGIASVKSSEGSTAKIYGKKEGTAYIYAKAGKTKLKCKVKVKKSFISADKDDISIADGKPKKITLTVKGSKDIMILNSNPSVCSYKWGQWKGNKITLTLKPLKKGETELTVYTKGYEKTDRETIEVSVGKKSNNDDDETDDEDEDEYDEYGDYVEDVASIVNEERVAEGKQKLEVSSVLTEAAMERAEELEEKYSHTRPDGSTYLELIKEKGMRPSAAGENIAAGYTSPENVMDGWMDSKGHRQNILNGDYTKIGVGVYEGSDGMIYWVQIFSS